MRALIQRVRRAQVTVGEKIAGQIGQGYLILLGVSINDSEKEAKILAGKTVNLRIMNDKDNKMNLSILENKGEILVVSQFTLYADMKGGRRPSFINAAKGGIAEKLYGEYIKKLKKLDVLKVEEGIFGAYMDISLVNDGPVTVMLDTDYL